LLVLKPHPAQDMSLIKAEDLSNFMLLTNRDLDEHRIRLYELLSMSDALITDYSSVYIDYLLTDKPIAITTDDIDQYKEEIGFLFEDVYEILKGEYVKDKTDMISFIQNVANDTDAAKEERRNIAKKLHSHRDGHAAERLYDLIKDRL